MVVFAMFLGWIQFTGQDWKYWTPLIHGGLMTLIGAGIGAWFGTLKTEDAAMKAAEFAGDETRKAMREQVQAQARIAEDKEQKNLALQVLAHINEPFNRVVWLFYNDLPLRPNKEDELDRYLLPLEIEALLFQLNCLTSNEKTCVQKVFIVLRTAYSQFKISNKIDDSGAGNLYQFREDIIKNAEKIEKDNEGSGYFLGIVGLLDGIEEKISKFAD